MNIDWNITDREMRGLGIWMMTAAALLFSLGTFGGLFLAVRAIETPLIAFCIMFSSGIVASVSVLLMVVGYVLYNNRWISQ